MIRVFIDREDALQSWYAEKMVPVIQNKTLSTAAAAGISPGTGTICAQMAALTEDAVRDILLLPLNELMNQYPWIEEYVRFCDAITGFPLFKEIQGKELGHQITELREVRREYLDSYFDCALFREVIAGSGKTLDEAAQNWESMKKVIKAAGKTLDALNTMIGTKFNYDDLTSETRGALVERMDVTVCPYCNMQYIPPVLIEGSTRYLGDLDHVLPKSTYSLFSLSLWNLIPSCKACNQIFKKNHGARILNPHQQGFDNDCILTLHYRSTREIIGLEPPAEMRWEIQPSANPGDRKQMEHNLRIFRLNEVYRCHTPRIQKTLRQRYLLNSSGYRKSLQRLLQTQDGPLLWYGVSLEPSKFQNEILSKAIYDTIYHN